MARLFNWHEFNYVRIFVWQQERAAVATDSERKSSKRSSSAHSSEEEEPEGERINYSFYDPEEHWCRVCDVFPATAKEYLNHLQSEGHKETIVVTIATTTVPFYKWDTSN